MQLAFGYFVRGRTYSKISKYGSLIQRNRKERPPLGVAIVSLIVLTILGAIGGLVLSRVLAGAPARNEDAPGDGEDERGSQEDNLSEENKRSFRFFLGAAAAISAVLISALAVVSAFTTDIQFESTGLPAGFLGFILGLVGYFLGARRLGAGAIVFTVLAAVLGAVIITMR